MTPRHEDQQTNARGRARGADAANPDAAESQSAVSQQDEADSVSVRVLFFGAARDAATDEAVLSLARASTARDAFERVLDVYPDLRRFRSSLLVAVNQEYARDLDITLKDGDELALFPPVSGGSDEPVAHAGDDAQDFFELTTDPIDVGSVARRVVPR